jgi:hypothetical protein
MHAQLADLGNNQQILVEERQLSPVAVGLQKAL